jgi:hypothetical protein
MVFHESLLTSHSRKVLGIRKARESDRGDSGIDIIPDTNGELAFDAIDYEPLEIDGKTDEDLKSVNNSIDGPEGFLETPKKRVFHERLLTSPNRRILGIEKPQSL